MKARKGKRFNTMPIPQDLKTVVTGKKAKGQGSLYSRLKN